MNITNLFGKQVFALYEGEIVGTIVEANFNNNFTKVVSLKIFDSEENEYEIKFRNIKAVSDCVIVANKSKLTPYFEMHKRSIMFKPVVDAEAKEYGVVIDCEIDSLGNITNILTDKNISLTSSKLHLLKNFIYYTENKFSVTSCKPKNSPLSYEDIKVSIQTSKERFKNDNFSPTKVQYNSSSLVGKVAKDNLFGINNEIIIKANQIITEKTILDASKHNRLNQLYFLAV